MAAGADHPNGAGLPAPPTRTIYTLGHSNRSIESFLSLVEAHAITQIVDIRAIPYSAYNPQFNREALEAPLRAIGVLYRHDQNLAGDPPDRQTMDRATRCSDRSRGYWSHMESAEFEQAVNRLLEPAHARARIALMCGELHPEHCHRYQTAHALDRLGMEVVHIIDAGSIRSHQPQLF